MPVSLDFARTLQWMRRHGIKPVALAPRSKAALSREYAQPQYSPPPDAYFLQNDLNLGMVTGPLENGAIDVDLDCEEAIYFAARFFPETKAVFGRPGKPRSHMLYRCTDPTFEGYAWRDPIANTTILELRGDGGLQTVAPGSVHQDTGELISWEYDNDPDLTESEYEALVRFAKKVVIAVLIVRYIFKDGFRNDAGLWLAGIFNRCEWTLDETLELLGACYEYQGDKDKSRLPSIRSTFMKAARGNAKIAGSGKLRKNLPEADWPALDKVMELAGNETINIINEYNERFAVVNYEGKMRVADLGFSPGEGIVFMQRDDFIALHASERFTNSEGKKVPKAQLWLLSESCNRFKVDFKPGMTETPGFLNLWTGWAVEPDKEASYKHWMRLLKEVICGEDGELIHWVLNWLAGIIQDTMNKTGTSLVLVGEQGAGKSLFFQYFGEILGQHYVAVTDAGQIHGKHNKHLATALLLHSEEALYAGDKRHRSVIKSLITDKNQMLEPKGIDAKQVQNYMRVALTSNDLQAAPAEAGDRRYTVINMGTRAVTKKQYKEIRDERKRGGPAALLAFLMNYKYDEELASTNIKNEDLRDMQHEHLSPFEEWWFETLKEGRLLPESLSWAQDNPEDGSTFAWPYTVGVKALYASAAYRIKMSGSAFRMTPTSFGMRLKEFVYPKERQWQKIRRNYDKKYNDYDPQEYKTLDMDQYAYTNFPELELCRKAFERKMKQVGLIKWEDPDNGIPEHIRRGNEPPKPKHERF